MANVTSAPVQAPAPENIGAVGRIFGVLFSPKETFKSIVQRPTWLLPVVLLILLAVVVVGIFDKRGGWPPYFQRQDASSSRFEQLSQQRQQRTLALQIKYGPRAVYAEVAIIIPLAIVVVAAIFLAIFNLIYGTQLKFKTAFSVVSYAWVPGIILGILGVVVVLLKDPATVDIQNVVIANASAFISSDAARWKIMLLSSVDIFSFWEMFLMAVGFGVAAPRKLTTAKAFVSIFIVWLIYVALKVGATAALS